MLFRNHCLSTDFTWFNISTGSIIVLYSYIFMFTLCYELYIVFYDNVFKEKWIHVIALKSLLLKVDMEIGKKSSQLNEPMYFYWHLYISAEACYSDGHYLTSPARANKLTLSYNLQPEMVHSQTRVFKVTLCHANDKLPDELHAIWIICLMIKSAFLLFIFPPLRLINRGFMELKFPRSYYSSAFNYTSWMFCVQVACN